MGVAVPTAFVSLGDLTSTRNSLDTMLNQIDTNTGELPESGPPLNARGSDTYQAWTLVGVHSYVLYSNDMAWLAGATWDRYKLATEFLVRKIVPETGLMDVTGRPDWALLDRGGQNPEGNALLYRVRWSSYRLTVTQNHSHSYRSSRMALGWLTGSTTPRRPQIIAPAPPHSRRRSIRSCGTSLQGCTATTPTRRCTRRTVTRWLCYTVSRAMPSEQSA